MSVREDGTSIIQARVADKRLARFKEIAEPRMQDDLVKPCHAVSWARRLFPQTERVRGRPGRCHRDAFASNTCFDA